MICNKNIIQIGYPWKKQTPQTSGAQLQEALEGPLWPHEHGSHQAMGWSKQPQRATPFFAKQLVKIRNLTQAYKNSIIYRGVPES